MTTNTNPASPRVLPALRRTRDSISRKLRDFAADPAKYAGSPDVADPAPDPKEKTDDNDD